MHQMCIHTPEIIAQHLVRDAVTAVAQAISLPYAGNPVLTDSSTEHPGNAEDNPALSQKDTKC